MVVKDARPKEIHSKIVKCLVILRQIKDRETTEHRTTEEVEVSEVNKVSRKLRMWPNRQNQYNAKILNAFLELRRKGRTKITRADIDNKLGPNTWFFSNFAQMKTISDKNHGKVFHQIDEIIEIWEPVARAVDGYESNVFTNA